MTRKSVTSSVPMQGTILKTVETEMRRRATPLRKKNRHDDPIPGMTEPVTFCKKLPSENASQKNAAAHGDDTTHKTPKDKTL
jgi:hypothetical protein